MKYIEYSLKKTRNEIFGGSNSCSERHNRVGIFKINISFISLGVYNGSAIVCSITGHKGLAC